MIELKNVTKVYDGINGIKNINMIINSRETVSLIGPNGAGKSTLIKLLNGTLKADSGDILFDGKPTDIASVREHIGYMPDTVRLSDKITAWELLHLISDIKFKGNEKEYINYMIPRYHIEQQVRKRFVTLSLGTQKKVALIVAMMGEPDILLFDEPTTGLDTEGILTLKQDILKAKSRGGCIIISSHILDFISAIADRNVFLSNGQIAQICNSENNLEEVYKELFLSHPPHN